MAALRFVGSRAVVGGRFSHYASATDACIVAVVRGAGIVSGVQRRGGDPQPVAERHVRPSGSVYGHDLLSDCGELRYRTSAVAGIDILSLPVDGSTGVLRAGGSGAGGSRERPVLRGAA